MLHQPQKPPGPIPRQRNRTSQPELVTADIPVTGELPTEMSASAFRLRISPRMLQVGEFPDNLGMGMFTL